MSENTNNISCSQTSEALLGGQVCQEEQTGRPIRMCLRNIGALKLGKTKNTVERTGNVFFNPQFASFLHCHMQWAFESHLQGYVGTGEPSAYLMHISRFRLTNGRDRRITHKRLVGDSCGFLWKSNIKDKIFHRCKGEKQQCRDLLLLIIRSLRFCQQVDIEIQGSTETYLPPKYSINDGGIPIKRTLDRNVTCTVKLVDTPNSLRTALARNLLEKTVKSK
ncbi:hypothetical protein T265_07756 [Opisthorchis viverrini]|uniref:Uncharacterized protein n=1 Tax=Opisthorchis viverrini TaxID=6198 RepID=A0A074ZMM4_OPIVI|nr:hypothetical protein T265_07756 [Opisthorchis viverrini]KER24610.1 hypothetical protein T265_07756 [Opisthorchis viverrini]